MSTILVVDDEIRIREVIKEYGSLYGYDVDEANDGYEAIDKVTNKNYDCIILDIMMPNLDGYNTCRKIKQIKSVPIIMLSARTMEDDKLYGFELGIDDYITKPFSPKELMARIKVVIERNNFLHATTQQSEIIIYKGIVIDQMAHTVTIDGEIAHLTNKEYDLLLYFINNPNRVIDREVLIEKIWGFDSTSSDRTIDTHIKMLRKNLKDYASCLVTVRGVGYRFEK